MKALKYDCHREFFFTHIYENYKSIDEFLAVTDANCSKSSLSHFFKRNKEGLFLRTYSFKIDTWLDILCSLNLTNAEIDYLMVLKLDEDISLKYSPKAPQKLVTERLLRISKHKKPNDINKLNLFSPEAQNISKIYDLLPSSFKNRMLKEVIKVVNYYIGGKSKAKTAPITKCLNELLK